MSADPRPLFYVAALVIAALVIWVISILTRKGEPWVRLPAAEPSSAPKQNTDDNGEEPL